jgi:hypothetical protein
MLLSPWLERGCRSEEITIRKVLSKSSGLRKPLGKVCAQRAFFLSTDGLAWEFSGLRSGLRREGRHYLKQRKASPSETGDMT